MNAMTRQTWDKQAWRICAVLLAVAVAAARGAQTCTVEADSEASAEAFRTCRFPVWDAGDKTCRTLDLAPLRDRVFSARDPDDEFVLKWTVCGNFRHRECELYDTGACTEGPLFGELGSWDRAPRPTFRYFAPAGLEGEGVAEGIAFDFRNTMCPGKKRVANTTLLIICPAPNQKEHQIAEQGDKDSCVFTLKMYNKAACGTAAAGAGSAAGAGRVGRAPSATTDVDPTTPRRHLTLSGGAVLLIILFMVAFCYILFGCVYARVAFGVTGIEAFPHITFWRELPGLVVEGCATTYTVASEFALCKQNRYAAVDGLH